MQSREASVPSEQSFSRFTLLVCAVLVIAGLVIPLAWYAGKTELLVIAPGIPSLRGNTGLVLLAAGLALALQEWSGSGRLSADARVHARRVAVLLAAGMILLGTLTLIEYVAGVGFGLDHWAPQAGTAEPWPGRMSVPAAVCGVMAGVALLLLDWETRSGHHPAEYLAILILGFMAVPLIGFMFSVTAMVKVAAPQGVGPHTAVLFMLLGLGLLTARPRHRVMALWNSDGPGAALVRRLLPKSLLLLLVLFLMVDRGARLGFYGYEKVSPLVVLLAAGWLSVLFWRAGAMLNRESEERRMREQALSETSTLLRVVSDNTPDAIYVKDRNGRLVFANPSTARMLGRNGDDLRGLSSAELFANDEDARTVDANDRAVMEARRPIATEESIHREGRILTVYSTKTPWFTPQGELAGLIGISTDISERKRVEDALREHETHLERLVHERTAEVSELIGHIESTREEEKRAIARELHDDLGSALTALSMHLAILFQKMPADPVLAERAQQIKALLGSVTQTTRRIQVGLRPDKLDIFGIKTAISEQCLEFENYSGITCKADLPDEDLAYAPATEIALYRMLQEALNNVAKHSKATRVDVVLDDSEEGIVLSVRDNGVGMTETTPAGKLTHGLRGLRERAQYLGGEVRVASPAGKGTAVTIRLPRTSREAAPEAGGDADGAAKRASGQPSAPPFQPTREERRSGPH